MNKIYIESAIFSDLLLKKRIVQFQFVKEMPVFLKSGVMNFESNITKEFESKYIFSQ